MRLWDVICAPRLFANLTWHQHTRITLPFVLWIIAFIYLLKGYYIKVEIGYNPDLPVYIAELLLWLIGVEAAEL